MRQNIIAAGACGGEDAYLMVTSKHRQKGEIERGGVIYLGDWALCHCNSGLCGSTGFDFPTGMFSPRNTLRVSLNI